MRKLKRKSVITFLAVVAIALSGTSWLAQRVSAIGKGAYENVEAFANVLTLVQKHYVDDVTTKQLIDGAINGIAPPRSTNSPTPVASARSYATAAAPTS